MASCLPTQGAHCCRRLARRCARTLHRAGPPWGSSTPSYRLASSGRRHPTARRCCPGSRLQTEPPAGQGPGDQAPRTWASMHVSPSLAPAPNSISVLTATAQGETNRVTRRSSTQRAAHPPCQATTRLRLTHLLVDASTHNHHGGKTSVCRHAVASHRRRGPHPVAIDRAGGDRHCRVHKGPPRLGACVRLRLGACWLLQLLFTPPCCNLPGSKRLRTATSAALQCRRLHAAAPSKALSTPTPMRQHCQCQHAAACLPLTPSAHHATIQQQVRAESRQAGTLALGQRRIASNGLAHPRV